MHWRQHRGKQQYEIVLERCKEGRRNPVGTPWKLGRALGVFKSARRLGRPVFFLRKTQLIVEKGRTVSTLIGAKFLREILA